MPDYKDKSVQDMIDELIAHINSFEHLRVIELDLKLKIREEYDKGKKARVHTVEQHKIATWHNEEEQQK